ncbi:Phenylalanine--tRNA ligase beta subunit [Pirellulimonas nuda]|uniref:Phenylalanine--tRNA ligase beta subunit n=1 Tax=Pirellulimonas nuda TaxID=2528009 RepID=A0A518DGC7_9BACT|nr:phenylalanine--tRNA ligase subunit beta [Pirellulimonas nuda]QDU90530.1 Phenylalanine--tRNA ligase beta subunit [Pirellulimonas nuda]
MIVSWKWLNDYVKLAMSLDELCDRLTLTGLNLEGVEKRGDDWAIDLEVTSNRPDCLGHVGVAREVSVLWNTDLRKPDPRPKALGAPVEKLTSVTVTSPELCPRYTARVIRGVKIGPSPDWLAERLRSVGVAVINNVVDVTNFVMLECGQPLHAFDFAKLKGAKIIVRPSRAGEPFTAIDHKTYELPAGLCVIADAERPVAMAGVMGGFDTEVSESTVDVLIESADFEPMAVRAAARKHNLHSPSSYRFERGVDPEGIDWASRRACELILETAGGELCEGVIDVAAQATHAKHIAFRPAQTERILGIQVDEHESKEILTSLGCAVLAPEAHTWTVAPPSWRADLSREIDLIEEIARIHGYDRIPEDARVPLCPSSRTTEDVVLEQVRGVLTAAGFDEALTLSAVEPDWIESFRPWTQAAPLATSTSVLRRADRLRQSVVPSLLACRRTNETLSNERIEQFEIAKVYLPQQDGLPIEKRVLALASGGEFRAVKGVIETLFAKSAPDAAPDYQPLADPGFAPARGAEIMLAGQRVGVLGEASKRTLDAFDLRRKATVAEIDLGPLVAAAQLVRTAGTLSAFPQVARDLNVVFDLGVHWSEVERIAREVGGDVVEAVTFQDDSYRDPQQLGPGKKSVLFSVVLRKPDGTLTSEEADGVRDRIVAALGKELGGSLRA